MGRAQFRVVPHAVDLEAVPALVRPIGWSVVRGAQGFAWRLLSGNNRELGRSARAHDDLSACQAAVDVVRAQIAELVEVVHQDTSSGLWAWRFEQAGTPLARASRGYARQRECRYALSAFTAAVPEAAAALQGPAVLVGR